jgi:hypothetical protein
MSTTNLHIPCNVLLVSKRPMKVLLSVIETICTSTHCRNGENINIDQVSDYGEIENLQLKPYDAVIVLPDETDEAQKQQLSYIRRLKPCLPPNTLFYVTHRPNDPEVALEALKYMEDQKHLVFVSYGDLIDYFLESARVTERKAEDFKKEILSNIRTALVPD